MEQHKFNPGDLILQEGDESQFVYEILSGEVEIFSDVENQSVVLGTVKSGEFLGEMGIIDDQPRSASARAKTEVMAVILQKAEFMRIMSEKPSSAYHLIHRLSERLRAANSKIVETSLVGQPEGKLESEPLRVTLVATFMTPYVPKKGVVIQKFPYFVGRWPKQNEPRTVVPIDLTLPDVSPFRLSRQHFSLSHELSGYVVYDLGSKLGTKVNGEFLGPHFGKDAKTLELGENTITAGGMDSPYIFKVRLEKD